MPSTLSHTIAARPIRFGWRHAALAAHLVAAAGLAQAQSLAELYLAAQGYDAAYLAARSQFDANLAKADQGKAQLLPQVGLSAGATRSQRTQNPETTNPVSNYSYTTQTAGINATQPLYRPANLAAYRQSQKGLELAEAALSLPSRWTPSTEEEDLPIPE